MMRIASGTTDQYVYFQRQTGLSSFTVYRSRNGAAWAAMTTPTISEGDSTNAPGIYELLLDEDMTIGAGNATEALAFYVTHAGMNPVFLEVELFASNLTDIASILADTNEVQVSLAAGGLIESMVDDLQGDITSILADTNEVQISLAAGGLIESMVDDLQTEVDGIQADTEDIQSRLPAALINSRMDATVDGTGMEAAAVTAIQSGLATSAALTTVAGYLDTEIAAILAAVDTEVAAIKAKTDSLTFTVTGQVDANAVSMNDAEILGIGTSGNKWRGE